MNKMQLSQIEKRVNDLHYGVMNKKALLNGGMIPKREIKQVNEMIDLQLAKIDSINNVMMILGYNAHYESVSQYMDKIHYVKFQ